MNLYDFFVRQQQLLKTVFPPSLQNLILMQDRIKPHMNAYLKTFQVIENINKSKPHLNFLDNYDKIMKFSVKQYDFSSFFEKDDEEEAQKETILIDQTSRIKKIITDIYHDNSLLLKIAPREFEEIIAELLSFHGFKVELTKQTRDNGYDILALKYLDSHIPLKFLVECKRYKTKKIGVEIIRSFKDVIVTEQANRGIIVTTSYFTKDAQKKRLKETPYLLDYKDKNNVIEWVENYWKKQPAANNFL